MPEFGKEVDMAETIWMAVTPDKLELPITFGETCGELARFMRVPVTSIHQARWKEKKGIVWGGEYRVRKVTIEEDEE